MSVKYIKPKKMNHPLKLRESDVNRLVAVLNQELDSEWVSDEEMEAFQDQLFDIIASKEQTHEGSLVIQ
jgi:hypothetical protein